MDETYSFLLEELKEINNITQQISDSNGITAGTDGFENELRSSFEAEHRRWNQLTVLNDDAISEIEKLWKEESKLKVEQQELELPVIHKKDGNDALRAEIEMLEKRRLEIARVAGETHSEALRIAQQALIVQPTEKSINELLKNITRIKWDPVQKGGLLSGAVITPKGIKPFSYDLNDFTNRQVQSDLWNIMTDSNSFIGT